MPKVEAISEVLEVAERLLSAGVILFAMRIGKMDEFRELWDEATARLMEQMTPVDREVINRDERLCLGGPSVND